VVRNLVKQEQQSRRFVPLSKQCSAAEIIHPAGFFSFQKAASLWGRSIRVSTTSSQLVLRVSHKIAIPPPFLFMTRFSFIRTAVTKMTNKGGFIRRANDTDAGSPVVTSSGFGIRQLFDEDSFTYTYLLWDKSTKDAILIDPVDIQVDRDLKVACLELGLNLVYGVNTHAHADHITGTGILKQKVSGLKSVIAESSTAIADVHIAHGDEIHFGNRYIKARATPGHTNGCLSYVTDDQASVFTGDALLIMGCGRTDFQGGSSEKLYDSIHAQLFLLPDECVVYPAHDYKGRTSSTIGAEKAENPRLGIMKTKEEFVEIMANLNLPYPKKIDVAVPANLRCGIPDVE